MKKFVGLAIIGALSLLAFPGHDQIADAQNAPVANPPMSTNPEIAALQAQTAILQKQLGILNQKMDQVLAKLQAPPPTSATSTPPPPVAEPVNPPPRPAGPTLRDDGTILFNGNTYVPLSTTGACAPAQTTVSLMADACGASVGADAGGTSCGSAAGASNGRPGLFPRLRAWRARRHTRLGGGAGGCGG